jgi:MYXO-CTERM domain-containing protein
MKIQLLFLLTAVLLSPCASAQGMGTVNFTTLMRGSVDARVGVCRDAGVVSPAGPGYLATLYWGWTPDSLQPAMVLVGGVPTYLAKPFNGSTGYVTAGKQSIMGAPEGSSVFMQMRGWEGEPGSTYDEALMTWKAVGSSNVIRITLGGDNLVPPVIPTPLLGLQGFSILTLSCVPEPSPILLGLLGLLGLTVMRALRRRG